MAVEKVIPENKSPNNDEEMDFDSWIDINMKNICNKSRDRIKYLNRKNRPPNKYETQKIINELEKLDLADANALNATLTRKGEKVCKAGGWIEYLKQQENQTSSSTSSSFESPNNSGKTQKRNKIIPTIGAIKQAINSLSPIWKFILSIIAMVMASFLAYLLIEWYKTLSYV
jgi:hypothetical protein